MKTVHEGPLATVICGDAHDVLPTLEAESVDLVTTDPPYGREWRSNTRAQRFDGMAGDGREEAVKLLDELTPELVRVTRRTRHLYTFGLPMTHPLLPEKAKTELIWDKGRLGSGDLTATWAPSHETIFFHTRAADATNARQGAGSLTARVRRGSVLRVKRLSAGQVKRHPTEKPVDLMRQLIESSSLSGELVLDPFAGAGSTGVAAIAAGRRAFMVELDPNYAEIAAQRACQAEQLANEMAGI